MTTEDDFVPIKRYLRGPFGNVLVEETEDMDIYGCSNGCVNKGSTLWSLGIQH